MPLERELVSLPRQVDLVFKQLHQELRLLYSGIVFMQIRGNMIGKFGIRHDPIESRDGSLRAPASGGMSEEQCLSFSRMAIESLKYKQGWTHGEIMLEFAVVNNMLRASIQFESHYNMANLLSARKDLWKHKAWTAGATESTGT